jgi:virulence-associated protein VagC
MFEGGEKLELDFSMPCIYGIYMLAKVFKSGNSLALRLPKELHPEEGEVDIEVVGDRWIVSPRKPASWPKDFFKRIRLANPAPFKRPSQGEHREVRL